MRIKLLYILSLISLTVVAEKLPANFSKIDSTKNQSIISFTENKGQISDQNYKPRPDILFGGIANGMAFHLRNNGVSYQLNRVDSWKEKEDLKTRQKRKVADQSTVYRLDINWLKCNTSAQITKGAALPGYNNYYLEVCPNGVHYVKSYDEITYQNIYNGIDLKWYQKDGSLKYDYLVAAGADYKQIQLEIKGAEKINLNSKGELIVKTPLGIIIEQAPLVNQKGTVLKSKWVIKNNIISFDIENINPKEAFIIDPAIRIWGTYYGGTLGEIGYSCCTDAIGNVYLAGITNSNDGSLIATAGSHQLTYGGNQDAFLVQFNSIGVRQWGTYYGGAGTEDEKPSCTIDPSGNIYLAGSTTSSVGNIIATIGSHQAVSGGQADAFLVQFNSSGVRQWGTYYGDTGVDYGFSCITDLVGNVYLSGSTSASGGNVIATPSSHQPVFGGLTDAFLVQFNSNGVRQWGTYYGGAALSGEWGFSCSTDVNGNVYMAGEAGITSGTVIATVGSHQPIYGGAINENGFLVKFNSNGQRQWGTYYGGTNDDYCNSCSTDPNGNIYICGVAQSSTGIVISTMGSHQFVYGGGGDSFLVQFNTAGVRQWGTYYGGVNYEIGQSCSTDADGNVYLAGTTATSFGTSIATTGSYQSAYGGAVNIGDAFLAKFNSAGLRQWGTYYGGTGDEYGNSCNADANGNIYLAGTTTSSLGVVIASPGSHQANIGGGSDAFLVKFIGCVAPSAPSNTTPIVNQNICNNNSTALFATASGMISWFATPTSSSVLGTGTIYVTPTLSVGTYTFYAEALTCETSKSRTAITITVNPVPTLNISSSSNSLCSGQSATLNASGAISYTWIPGSSNSSSLLIVPSSSQIFTVIGIDALGCKGNFELNIPVTPTPTLTVTPFFYLCSGSATLNAIGAQTYSWFPGNLTGSVVLFSPSVTTNYTIVGANGNCTNSAMSTISLGVAPPFIINSHIQSGCKGTCFTFSNSSNAFNPFTYFWGDTSTSAPLITNHCFSVSGKYTVIAQAIYSIGCSVVSSNILTVTIFPSPIPGININNSNALSINIPVTFNNISTGAQIFVWEFGDHSQNLNALFSTDVKHTYSIAGKYCINLIATDTILGCKDSTTKCIDVLCTTEINIPNVFTPNDDGVNDVFTFKNNCVKSLNCTIYNRWGTKIYEWSGINGWWDGRTDAGERVSSGTYFFVLEYSDENNNVIKKKGYVSLFN